MSELALACLAFLVLHVVPSTPLRLVLVNAVGEKAYLGLFSLASLAGIVWMVLAFKAAPLTPLWPGMRHLPSAVMPFALIFLVSGVLTPNPSAVGAGKLLARDEPARGILRITRHPVMWGIMLWAAAHVLARGELKSLLFFGTFLVLAAVGTVLQDTRKAVLHGDAWARYARLTSNLPFVAIAQKRNRLAWRELGAVKILIALVLFALLFQFHPWLFGARPY
ncbi:MAG: NnrU family protein [Burkholderiales bacterium]|nr:NnrU family protein [Burkholderiales bacterium]